MVSIVRLLVATFELSLGGDSTGNCNWLPQIDSGGVTNVC